MATKRHTAEPSLGKVLMTARRAMQPMLSYEAIAKRLDGVDISHTTVQKYHLDIVKLPDLEIVLAFVEFYGLSLTDLPTGVRQRAEALRDSLVAASSGKWAARDSNPEPADSLSVATHGGRCVSQVTLKNSDQVAA